ncbi:MAG: DUF86 domain-containing protein [Chlorobiaceae bacterium]|nr:DUF86 domain-containing protein [Chlorobiaceae bacterium]
MDWEMINQKLESLRRSVARVKEKCPDSLDALKKDYDAQDIVTLNLSRAVQMCVDVGAHLLAESKLASPGTMGGTFEMLSEAGIISPDLAGKLKKAVGFRNLAVHNYDAINWAIVFAIATTHLEDFLVFAKAVVDFRQAEC